jgi:hypothetical protein
VDVDIRNANAAAATQAGTVFFYPIRPLFHVLSLCETPSGKEMFEQFI